jgi:hypothetical protein
MKQKQNELGSSQQRATRHSLHWCLLPMCMMIIWAGCKHGANVVVESNPVGTYNLVSVDGKQVPCTLQHEGHTLAVKSGAFVINPDGTCSSKMVFSPPSGGDATREVKANYTRQGSKLTMQWQGAGVTAGTLESDTFTMNNEGMIFAYRK